MFAVEDGAGADGKRKFVVATYASFWARYAALPPLQRHFYEVIPEGAPCHLYFDVEHKRARNPALAGQDDAVVAALLGVVAAALLAEFGLRVDAGDVVDLDASNAAKFSRHLVVHLPGHTAFASNADAGAFVKVRARAPGR